MFVWFGVVVLHRFVVELITFHLFVYRPPGSSARQSVEIARQYAKVRGQQGILHSEYGKRGI